MSSKDRFFLFLFMLPQGTLILIPFDHLKLVILSQSPLLLHRAFLCREITGGTTTYL